MRFNRLVRGLSVLCLALLGVAPAGAQSVDPAADQREDAVIPRPAGGGLGFGASVAMDEGTLVIGAPYFAPAGGPYGAASIYTRAGDSWMLQQTLPTPSGLGFGGSVDVSGDTVIVGANNYGSAPPHARVYLRTGSAWALQATLIPTDYVPGSDWTAVSVAIDGETAVVGTVRGASYVFVRTGTTWTQQAKLTAGVAGISYFGARSVALDGDTAVIGAPYATVGANVEQGAALVFVRSGGTWITQGTLTLAAGRANRRFGATIALSGDTAMFVGGGSSTSHANWFTRAGGVWVEQPPLVAPNTGIFAPSLASLAVDGDTAILGHYGFYAYVFRRINGQWTFQDRLVSGEDGDPYSELFGVATAVDGGLVVVGAPDYGRSEDTNGPGRAYEFTLPSGPPGAPALTGSVSGTTVTLSWTPPAGAAPSAYVVEAGSSPGTSNVFVGNVGNVLILSTSAPLGTYYVRVRGVNAFGPGASSNEITLTVGTPPPPLPGPPTLTGSVSQGIVSLAWTPAATGGVPTSYVLEAGTTLGATNLYNGNVGAGTALTATVTPAVYYIRVRGRNASGTGPASNEIVLTSACAVPATPTGLTFSVAGRTVNLSWNPTAGVTAYVLEAGTSPGAANAFNAPVGAGTTLAAGAPPGTYYVRLRAANACGLSTPSPEVVIVVP